uniref:NADH:ubiquinone reductase (H(+)-translocating) n=1 Tax=Polycarpa mytiligera TaxID=569436 RepID=S0DGU3_POLMY|nr:NADH dehydrogenase subunit 5 [Polycarpa mytiligera]CCO25748.1 NADH dehydrogenase subunit 5 [Polycarpa mytiligera]
MVYFMLFQYLFVLLWVGFLMLMLYFLLLFFFNIGSFSFYKKIQKMYKWGILSIFFMSFFSLVFGGFVNYVLFQETRLWLMNSPLLHMDTGSMVFFSFALFVSWSIMNFGVDYMSDEKGVGYFLGYLILFLFFMFFLVFSGSFMVLFIGWEGVGLLSFLLISWWGYRMEAVSGSMQAVIYNRVGDAGLLLFLVMYLILGNSLFLGESLVMSVLFFLFVLGVLAKSSQFLFHPWLPNAMEGPTPVSSLLHSSTMVVAGVYLLMRCMSMFSISFMVFVVGLLSCVLGGVFGFSQFDFKKVVAYSTTSQLGFMMMMLGLGFTGYCMLYMMAHAFFKAMIFMMSGVVIHMAGGAQDFRGMNTMILLNNLMSFLYVMGALVMMGLPFLSAFWIKDLVLEETNFSYLGMTFWFFFGIAIVLTSLYSMRLYFGLFEAFIFNQKKLMMGKSLVNFYSYIRLFLGSVGVGLLFFMYYGPMGHILMTSGTKMFGLIVLVLGVLVSFFLIKFSGFGFYKLGYLLYYNPLAHKFSGGFFYKISEYTILLDFIFMEYFFSGGIFYTRGVVSSMRVFLFFLFIFLMLSTL